MLPESLAWQAFCLHAEHTADAACADVLLKFCGHFMALSFHTVADKIKEFPLLTSDQFYWLE